MRPVVGITRNTLTAAEKEALIGLSKKFRKQRLELGKSMVLAEKAKIWHKISLRVDDHSDKYRTAFFQAVHMYKKIQRQQEQLFPAKQVYALERFLEKHFGRR